MCVCSVPVLPAKVYLCICLLLPDCHQNNTDGKRRQPWRAVLLCFSMNTVNSFVQEHRERDAELMVMRARWAQTNVAIDSRQSCRLKATGQVSALATLHQQRLNGVGDGDDQRRTLKKSKD